MSPSNENPVDPGQHLISFSKQFAKESFIQVSVLGQEFVRVTPDLHRTYLIIFCFLNLLFTDQTANLLEDAEDEDLLFN